MKVAIIGCGNMVNALFEKGFNDEFEYYTYTPSATRAIELANKLKGTQVAKISDLPQCDLYLFGFKPQQLKEVASELQINHPCEGISLLAATSIKTLKNNFGESCTWTRLMPNTPVALGLGASLVYGANFKTVENVFSHAGEFYAMESEELFDKATLITGSGPALVFYYAQLFQEELIKMSIPTDQAALMVAQLFTGSSQMLKGVNSFQDRIDQVTSKGGVTIAALDKLRESMPKHLSEAVLSGICRSKEITKELDKH
jgi:pyrroline-5-carboxylate reductase